MKHLTQHSPQQYFRRNHSRKLGYKQSGASLIISLILLGVMTIVGVSTMNNSIIQEKLAGNFEAGVGAMQNAETGIADTIAVIEANFEADQIDLLLADPNNLEVLNDNAESIFYTVNIIDNDDGDGDLLADTDGIFLFNAIGRLNGAARNIVVRASLFRQPFDSNFAILTEEPITFNGDTDVDGSLNDVHSNGLITVSHDFGASTGVREDSGHVSSHAGISRTINVLGTYEEYAPRETIPDIVPSDFKDQADYILRSDGTIINTATGFLEIPATLGWRYESGSTRWRPHGSADPAEGLYYSETNIKMAASIGTSATPWNGGFLSEGTIDVSGSFNIDSSNNNNLLFLAADDIQVSGSGDASGEGLIATQGQLAISGSGSIEGYLISNGSNDTSRLVTKNVLSGNVDIIHNDSNTPFTLDDAGVTKLSWQQVIQ